MAVPPVALQYSLSEMKKPPKRFFKNTGLRGEVDGTALRKNLSLKA